MADAKQQQQQSQSSQAQTTPEAGADHPDLRARARLGDPHAVRALRARRKKAAGSTPTDPAGGDLTDAQAAAGEERKPQLEDERVSVGEGEGMMAFEVSGADIEKMRARQIKRAIAAGNMGRLAIERFDSILRARAAKGELAKGFGSVTQKTAEGWYRDNLKKAIPFIDVADFARADGDMVSMGVGAVMGGTAKVGLKEIPVVGTALGVLADGVEGQSQAAQAAARLTAVDQLVSSARIMIQKTTDDAVSKLLAAGQKAIVDADAATDDSVPPISEAEVSELIATLDAQLKEAMFKSGTETTSEYLDDLKGRRNLGAEIDQARATHPASDKK